jgi:hypothetical protein
MSETKSSKPQGIAAEEEQEVDTQQVKTLFGGEGGTEAISGNGFTYRHDWGDRNGQWKLNLNWPGVLTPNSRVFVAIAEGAAGGGKMLQAAKYTLHNVAPQDGKVGIWLNIEWSSPIRLSADYLIINP